MGLPHCLAKNYILVVVIDVLGINECFNENI